MRSLMCEPRRRGDGAARFLACAMLAALIAARPGGAAAPDPATLLREAEAARSPISEGLVRLRIGAERNGMRTVEGDLDLYTGGFDRFLAAFRSGKQRGRKILVQGERTWLIVPGARNPLPVSGQQRLSGAASVSDLARLRLSSQYRGRLRDVEEEIRGVRCAVVDLEGTAERSDYPSGVLWSGAEDHLPRRLLLRLHSGKEARILDFVRYRTERGRQVVDLMELRDLLRRSAEVTILEFLAYEPRTIDPALFTPEGARALLE